MSAALIKAVGELIKSKGRFHTEQNYRAVVEAFCEISATPTGSGVGVADAEDDSLTMCVSDLEQSCRYDSKRELIECVLAIANRISAIAKSK